MEEPRKIVLILGNGFDLDLGLKTSYKDFWESEYCPKNYPAPLIHHLNQCWTDNLNAVKWYDLENELLEYYRNTVRKRKYYDVISPSELKFLKIVKPEFWVFGSYNQYVDDALSLYDKGYILFDPNHLQQMSIPFHDDMLHPPIWRDRKALNLIKQGLCKYLSSFNYDTLVHTSMARTLIELMKCIVSQNTIISIYSFNFTPTLSRYNQTLAKIVKYVHGSCEFSNTIIGTGDTLDISDDYSFLIKSFDATYNPPALVEDLLNSDETIIFGHSIGKNDRMYFKAFFKQQVDYSNPRRKDITIFTRDEESELQIKRTLMEMTDGNLSALYGLNNIHLLHTSKLDSEAEKMRALILRQNINKDKVSELLCYLHD